MVLKRYCDVCKKEIPNNIVVPHNVATKMYSGTFTRSAIVVDEMDDLCSDCSKKVRDFIRELKRKWE